MFFKNLFLDNRKIGTNILNKQTFIFFFKLVNTGLFLGWPVDDCGFDLEQLIESCNPHRCLAGTL